MSAFRSWLSSCARTCACVVVLAISLTLPAQALQPGELLSDPALEARARAISAGLRCLVCQNQSIDDSDAPLARDLRVLVRERLKAGDTDGEIEDFVVARYGEFVLLKPRFAPHTLLLWLAAPVVLMAAILALFFSYRRASRPTPDLSRLSPQEKRRLKKLLDQG